MAYVLNPFIVSHWQQIKADGAIGGAIVSFCVSVAALSISLLNRRRDKIKNTMTYLDEWRSPSFTADRDFITRDISTRITSPYVQNGYSGLSKEESGKIRHVSHYLEYLGTMMKNGHVDEKLILEQIGEPVEQLWMILGHFIHAERAKKAEGVNLSALKGAGRDHHSQRYQHGFEHIAARSQHFRLGRAQRMDKYTGELRPLLDGVQADRKGLEQEGTHGEPPVATPGFSGESSTRSA